MTNILIQWLANKTKQSKSVGGIRSRVFPPFIHLEWLKRTEQWTVAHTGRRALRSTIQWQDCEAPPPLPHPPFVWVEAEGERRRRVYYTMDRRRDDWGGWCEWWGSISHSQNKTLLPPRFRKRLLWDLQGALCRRTIIVGNKDHII